ncbi:MAG: hypothetical protein ACRC1M_06050 [Methanobacteriaceae archaeon]
MDISRDIDRNISGDIGKNAIRNISSYKHIDINYNIDKIEFTTNSQ